MKISNKRFVLSDQTKNLYGFTTITAGIDLSAFKENPVMLYNHDYDKLIGQWVNCEVDKDRLTAQPSFDQNDSYAIDLFNKVEAGILKGASIGISPLKFDETSNEMSASLLLEASLTPVPNNRNALAMYSVTGQQLSADQASNYLLSLKHTDPSVYSKQSGNETYDYLALNAPRELEDMMLNDAARYERLVAEKVKSVRLNCPHYFDI